MSHKKKTNPGDGKVRGGSKRTGSRGPTQAAPHKTTSKKPPTKSTAKSSPDGGAAARKSPERTHSRPRTQQNGRRKAAETAPSLAQAPRRKQVNLTSPEPTLSQGASDEAKIVANAVHPEDVLTAVQPDIAVNAIQPDQAMTADKGLAETESEPDNSRFSEPYLNNPMDFDMLGIGSPVFPPGGFNLETEIEESDDFETGVGIGTPWADDPSVEMRIREIEERLDGLMAAEPHEDLDHSAPTDPVLVAPSTADTAVDAAREILESDYYRKKWGRSSLRALTNEIDEFGMDPAYEEKLRPALDFLFKRYFRVEVEGVRNVPAQGRAVVVANHSGALPFDGVMLREAIRQRHSGRNDMRWLAEDFSFYLPFLGVTLNRLGAVRACPENAERLLSKEHLVGVFPEGAEGIKKLYRDRYRLQRFGRGGFVRLCLKTQSPIIPCAIIGAEETNPIIYRFDNLSKLLGLDYLPITPTFPLLGPFGLLPAPTKWRIVFGDLISVDEYGPQAAQDHVLVGRLAERVRSSIKDLLETALRRRKSIWL